MRNVTNAPWKGTENEVCATVMNFATPPAGAYGCGRLLYYVTEIPVTTGGGLFGTLEFNDGGGFIGASSVAQSNIDMTPEFEPGLAAYDLPASNVDSGGVVSCP